MFGCFECLSGLRSNFLSVLRLMFECFECLSVLRVSECLSECLSARVF